MRTTGRVGDLVMWDNRRTMHRGRPFPAHEPRDVRRTTLKGDGPTVAQQQRGLNNVFGRSPAITERSDDAAAADAVLLRRG